MKQWILEYPQIIYDGFLWGYNAKRAPGYRHWPFILRPVQIELVNELNNAICKYPQHDLLIDKSREEGATEIVSAFFVILWLLVPDSALLVGSRKEQYVDAATDIVENRVIGSPRSIFHKILYKIATGPTWLRPQLIKSHMRLENLDIGSVIDGEATNENFGAGDRRTAILLDEFGRVKHDLAQSIRETVSDVSDAVIYNSTHFYGRGHSFGQLRFSGKIKVFTLPWFSNPEKAKGLYRSPEIDKVEILDTAFKFPEKYSFILAGDNRYRSFWYDREAKRRDPRDLAMNVDMNPVSGGDVFFDPDILLRIRTGCLKNPDYIGSISYIVDRNKILNVKFVKGFEPQFRWWGGLIRNRPLQEHNYLVSCDVALGTGTSNSVAKVYDLETSELKGMYLSSKIPPSDFCDQVIAICQWVAGQNRYPFLVWEANGPGILFDQRRRIFGYTNIFIDTITRAKYPRRTKKPGFYTTRTSKYDVLLELRSAISEGLKKNPTGKFLQMYDELTLREYEDYIFYEDGNIGLSGNVTDTGGAKAAHGDTVITDAMAVHCFPFAARAIEVPLTGIMAGSLGWRREKRRQEEEKDKKESIWLM